MQKILLSILSLCLSLVAYSAPNAFDAEVIFQQADNINQLDDNMQFNVAVTTDKRSYEFAVFINNRENSIVKYIKPDRDNGKLILAKGLDMWVFIPSGKRPVRISPQQRLVGSVSNIDIARIALGIDYRATAIAEAEYNGNSVWLLSLDSQNTQSLYDKVELLVAKDNNSTEQLNQFAPLKATFYTKSGQAAKTMTFSDYQDIQGKRIATTRIIVDLLTGHRAELKYFNFQKSTISDEYFQPNAFAFF